jgi:hypothetical protein
MGQAVAKDFIKTSSSSPLTTAEILFGKSERMQKATTTKNHFAMTVEVSLGLSMQQSCTKPESTFHS